MERYVFLEKEKDIQRKEEKEEEEEEEKLVRELKKAEHTKGTNKKKDVEK